MRRPFLTLSFALLAAAALAANLGCGSNFPGSGAAGRGGSGLGGAGGSGGAAGSAGSTGSGGTGGNGGGGGAGTGGCAAGGGATTGPGAAGGGGALTPEQIDEALLNAPTTGGVLVTRAQPTSDYPACQ